MGKIDLEHSSLTDDQKACIRQVGGPLLVSAGAGSGKTFMLTQRIAYALLHPELVDPASSEPSLDIDEILAITFTSLAANEIKARVRNQLRTEGLAEQALKVDASWISTIHGMCSRILHEHALELGIDPAFALLDDTDRDALLATCVNDALKDITEKGDTRFDVLFSEYERTGEESAVGSMLTRLIDTASNVRGGLDAIVSAEPMPPHEIACEMYDAMVTIDAQARTGITMSGSQDDATRAALDALHQDACGIEAFEALKAKADLGYPELARTMQNMVTSFWSRTKNGELKSAKDTYLYTRHQLCREVACGLVAGARDALLTLAREVQARFDEAKRRAGVLDQNDLLLKTLDAFEHHPSIEAEYRDRFKLVMVDEFQDTSALQIALIDHLTDGNRRLCTVGDTQQSIYRFRGADVATYLDHKHEMRALQDEGGMCRELDINWRSHGDIITFVNRLFAADSVFGASGEFIQLDFDHHHEVKADGTVANPFPQDAHRIDIVCTAAPHHRGSADQRHLVEAEAIARRFEEIHHLGKLEGIDKNCNWGDMVILLGSMSRAEMYAQTLRAHAIPCTIAGGSGFDKTPEAQTVAQLLACIANPHDDATMLGVLTGDVFGLDANELTELVRDPKRPGRVLGYWEGLRAATEDAGQTVRTQTAAALLTRAVRQAGRRRPSETLTYLVIESGWLTRLRNQGVEGMASAANVLKTIRLVEQIEGDQHVPRPVATCAERLALKLAKGMKERPGVLMTSKKDAVRIMTIHSSKGLEFPIVALADFYGMRSDTEPLLLETVKGTIYLGLKPRKSTADKVGPYGDLLKNGKPSDTVLKRLEEAGELQTPELETCETAGQMLDAIKARAAQEELGELRRKFYVGATRPREALIVAVNGELTKDMTCKDVVEDLRRAVMTGKAYFATHPEGLDFGGERRAAIEVIDVERRDGAETEQALFVNDERADAFLHPAIVAEYGVHAEDPIALEDEGDDASKDGVATSATEGSASEGDASETDETPAHEAAPFTVPAIRADDASVADLTPARRSCNTARAGVFSYSQIAGSTDATDALDAAEHEAWDNALLAEVAQADGLTFDGEGAPLAQADRRGGASATGFGSALHLACQWMAADLVARRATDARACWTVPADARLGVFARTWGVGEQGLAALKTALAAWTRSPEAQAALGFDHIAAEAPFFVHLAGPQGEPIHLEGSIDLLCSTDARHAFIVDYKTGAFACDSAEHLHQSHALQAACYALAVLKQGYTSVELSFVHLEVAQGTDGTPLAARYRFGAESAQELEELVRRAYESKPRSTE